MSGHIHAELMAQYAEDARETSRPWERWECETACGQWAQLGGHPVWMECIKYRRKPRTITINGREVPEPMRDAPERISLYFLPDVSETSKSKMYRWNGDRIDAMWLSRGLVHSTKEAAIAHAEALLSFTEAK